LQRLTCEPFTALDEEILMDFLTCFKEAAEEVEETIGHLDNEPANEELIHKLFRAMHSLKGNCRMVFLDPLVVSTHELEEIVQEIRNGLFPYEQVFGEFMLAAIDQLEIVVQELINEKSAEAERLNFVDDLVKSIRAGEPNQQSSLAKIALEKIYDYAAGMEVSATPDTPVTESDIDTLKRLTERVVALGMFDQEKFNQTFDLCVALNNDLNSPCDEDQLKAAIYMRIFSKALRFRDENGDIKSWFEDSYEAGSEILNFMPQWHEAIRIMEERFENVDGSGPRKLAHDNIHPGAKILRIVGHFTNVLANRGDARFKKTLLKAVTELNANVQVNFDQHYVEAFNLLVRRRYIGNR